MALPFFRSVAVAAPSRALKSKRLCFLFFLFRFHFHATCYWRGGENTVLFEVKQGMGEPEAGLVIEIEAFFGVAAVTACTRWSESI